MLGPVLGGYLIAPLGLAYSYVVAFGLLLLALLQFVRIAPRPLPPMEGDRLGLRESVLSGLKFIFSNQLVLAALSLDMFAVLFGGAVALLVVVEDGGWGGAAVAW